jgi:hypothetical protein
MRSCIKKLRQREKGGGTPDDCWLKIEEEEEEMIFQNNLVMGEGSPGTGGSHLPYLS